MSWNGEIPPAQGMPSNHSDTETERGVIKYLYLLYLTDLSNTQLAWELFRVTGDRS